MQILRESVPHFYVGNHSRGSSVLVARELVLACRHEVRDKKPPYFVRSHDDQTQIRILEHVEHPTPSVDLVALWLERPYPAYPIPLKVGDPERDEELLIGGYPIESSSRYTEIPASFLYYGSVKHDSIVYRIYPNLFWGTQGMFGSSGGAVVDKDGNLVAINKSVSRLKQKRFEMLGQPISIGVPAWIIAKFIDILQPGV